MKKTYKYTWDSSKLSVMFIKKREYLHMFITNRRERNYCNVYFILDRGRLWWIYDQSCKTVRIWLSRSWERDGWNIRIRKKAGKGRDF